MLRPFCRSDFPGFLALATAEGWICGEWELEFLLQTFPQGCLAYSESGHARGYVTSVRHGKSGWIGNLVVAPEARGRGVGKSLIEAAISALLHAGVETVWLTASPLGIGLYKKLGFVSLDSVNRWVGEGTPGPRQDQIAPRDQEVVCQVDRSGWGDERRDLLKVVCGRGRTYSSNFSFLTCQPWEQGTQLGPWGALFESQAEALLDLALRGAAGKVFLDVPAGNVAAAALLARRGFSIRGASTLMYLGVKPDYEPKRVFALASMGSMG